LKFIPEYEGATLEQSSRRWPVALRRRFVSALYYRTRKRWPYTPYRAAADFGNRFKGSGSSLVQAGPPQISYLSDTT